MPANLEALFEYCRDTRALVSAQILLQWDQETLLPRKGSEGRARAMAALSRALHQRACDPRFAELLESCPEEPGLGPEGKSIVLELKRDMERSRKVPEAFAMDSLRSVNRVRPSLIRAEAEEATYNLHITARFELEVALFNGDLRPGDIESAWNEAMQKALGLTPKAPAEGFLQDVHWSAGQFGYFPSYTLGNLRAAQLFAAARREIPELDLGIRQGRFAPLKSWLAERVHRHGRRYPGEELMRMATGESTQAAPFMDYLKTKYLRERPGLDRLKRTTPL